MLCEVDDQIPKRIRKVDRGSDMATTIFIFTRFKCRYVFRVTPGDVGHLLVARSLAMCVKMATVSVLVRMWQN